jgi:hypothetical protein
MLVSAGGRQRRLSKGSSLNTRRCQAYTCPMVGVGREDPCPLALTLRLVRRLRGMKQAHAAELLGVTQSTVSHIERGELQPAGIQRDQVLDLVSAHPSGVTPRFAASSKALWARRRRSSMTRYAEDG